MKSATKVLLLALVMTGGIRAEEETVTEAVPVAPAPVPAVEVPVMAAEDTAALEAQVGSEVVVEGVVANVGTGPNDGITFLNFGDRRTGFVAVVFRPAYDKFPEGFSKYAQQKVRVRGTLEKFQDRQLQVKIFTADQLEIAEAAPAPAP
ncbi:MAG: OB-fold nucleic acid binding domain-containing protein [Chthoniobacterales bacterium]